MKSLPVEGYITKLFFCFEGQLYSISASLHVFMLIRCSYAELKVQMCKAVLSQLQMSFSHDKYFSDAFLRALFNFTSLKRINPILPLKTEVVIVTSAYQF